MAAPVIFVAGTWGLRDYETLERVEQDGPLVDLPWWHPRGAFADAARRSGLSLVDNARPFLWSTDVDGILGANTTWYAAGWALIYYAAAHGATEFTVVAHSHGGQIAAYAAAYGGTYGIRVHRILTVSTPVRRDMQRVRRRARGSIDGWWHVTSDHDAWRAAGEVADGQFGTGNATMPEIGTVNLSIPGYGHSGLLDDPGAFGRHNLWTVLRA